MEWENIGIKTILFYFFKINSFKFILRLFCNIHFSFGRQSIKSKLDFMLSFIIDAFWPRFMQRISIYPTVAPLGYAQKILEQKKLGCDEIEFD